MNLFETFATALAGWLTQAVLLGTTLALLTWCVSRFVLRKAPPAIHAGLWLVVLAKFILPLGPGFSYSLASLVGVPEVPAPTNFSEQSSTTYVVLETEAAGTATATASEQTQPQTAAITATPTTYSVGSLLVMMTVAAYLIGLVYVVAWRVRGYLRFAQQARRLPPAGRGLRRLVARVCRRSEVTRIPDVRLGPDRTAPYVFGLFRPILVIPRRAAMHGAELEAILLHEIAHLRRMDLLTRLAQWLAGNLLFFWPVVAWVNRRIDLAREHACDQWALAHGRLAPGQYARCLLRAVQDMTPEDRAFRPAAMAKTATQVERRITMILDHSQKNNASRWRLLAGGSLTAWAAFALAGTSVATEELPQETEKAVWVSDGGVMMLDGTAPSWTGDDNTQFFIVEEGDGAQQHAIALRRHIDESSLAKFRETYPMADADNDGTISTQEHDAFLVAVAMQDPERVLNQFPHADANDDGQLTASEAAGLVSGMPHIENILRGGNIRMQGAWTSEAPIEIDGTNENVFVENIATSDGEKMIVTRVATAGEPGEAGEVDVEVNADSETGEQIIRIARDGEVREILVTPNEDGEMLVTVNGEPVEGTATIDLIDGEEGAVGTEGVFVVEGGDEAFRVRTVHEAMHDGIQEHITKLHDHFMRLHGGDVDVEVHAGDGGFEEIVVLGDHQNANTHSAGSWILDNIEARPTREQVAGFVKTVADLPLAKFLELNPEADHNGDGVLTEKEREMFIKRHTSERRMRILEKYPDADLNEDGMLTNEELREYFRSKHRGHLDRTNVHVEEASVE